MKRSKITLARLFNNADLESYPRVVPLARSASSSAAMLKASGFNSVTQCSVALTSSILAIYAYVGEKKPGCAGQLGAMEHYFDKIDAGEKTALQPGFQ